MHFISEFTQLTQEKAAEYARAIAPDECGVYDEKKRREGV